MAHLIKRHSKPIKYLASLSEQMHKPHYVLTYKSILNRENLRSIFDDYKKQIRYTLEDYKSSCQQDRFESMKRGYNSERITILMGIIEASIQWQRNIEAETKAMLNLAKKMSENILNQSNCIAIKAEYIGTLNKQMREFFHVTITLSPHLFNKYHYIFASWPKLSDQISLLTITKYDKDPELSICISQEIFCLSLSGIDVGQLLSKINKFFLKT